MNMHKDMPATFSVGQVRVLREDVRTMTLTHTWHDPAEGWVPGIPALRPAVQKTCQVVLKCGTLLSGTFRD